MKKYLTILFILMTLSSCKKENNDSAIAVNSIAQDLKDVIEQEGVKALQHCCNGCSCSPGVQALEYETDYSFPGDNFVRIKEQYYNLNLLTKYSIWTAGSSMDSEIRTVLFFPK